MANEEAPYVRDVVARIASEDGQRVVLDGASHFGRDLAAAEPQVPVQVSLILISPQAVGATHSGLHAAAAVAAAALVAT